MEIEDLSAYFDNLLNSIKRLDKLHNASCLFLFVLAYFICSVGTIFILSLSGNGSQDNYLYVFFLYLLIPYIPVLFKIAILRKLHNFRLLEIIYNVERKSILNEVEELKNIVFNYISNKYIDVFKYILELNEIENQELVQKFIFLNKRIRQSTYINEKVDYSANHNFVIQSKKYEIQLHKRNITDDKNEGFLTRPISKPSIGRDTNYEYISPTDLDTEVKPLKSQPQPLFVQPVSNKDETNDRNFEEAKERLRSDGNSNKHDDEVIETKPVSIKLTKARNKETKKLSKRASRKAKRKRIKIEQKDRENKKRWWNNEKGDFYSTDYTTTDWISLHKRRIEIGKIGELIVLSYEKDRLNNLGRPEYARKVEHSSEIRGDSLGYDISSFDIDGKKIFIEVKTTIGSEKEEIYFTSNQLRIMKEMGESFCLYRVHSLDEEYKTCKIDVYKSYSQIYEQFEFIPHVYKLISRKQ